MMAYLLKQQYPDTIFVFANTGQENEDTLIFVDNCDSIFGLNVVWLEADVQDGRIGTKHKIVDYKSASRNGEPFEQIIKKYGIPNKGYPHCTRELKLQPIYSYLKTIDIKDYQVAIGIRTDEQRRVRKDAETANIIYPLIDMFPSDKEDVNTFWESQSFNLNLRPYQGNCKWCWKKSDAKLLKIMQDDMSIFDFPERMEFCYNLIRPERGVQTFFRQRRGVSELKLLYKECNGNLPKIRDEQDNGCSESCEVYQMDLI